MEPDRDLWVGAEAASGAVAGLGYKTLLFVNYVKYHIKGLEKKNTEDACHIIAGVSSSLDYFAAQDLFHNNINLGCILHHAAGVIGSRSLRD